MSNATNVYSETIVTSKSRRRGAAGSWLRGMLLVAASTALAACSSTPNEGQTLDAVAAPNAAHTPPGVGVLDEANAADGSTEACVPITTAWCATGGPSGGPAYGDHPDGCGGIVTCPSSPCIPVPIPACTASNCDGYVTDGCGTFIACPACQFTCKKGWLNCGDYCSPPKIPCH